MGCFTKVLLITDIKLAKIHSIIRIAGKYSMFKRDQNKGQGYQGQQLS